MMKSSVTISLVPELAGGPWVYWESLEISIPNANKLGFDAVELFIASANDVNKNQLAELLRRNNILLSAIGTGAGKVLHGLTLTNPDAGIRIKAREYISDLIRLAGHFGAPVIIGSMQGIIGDDSKREQSLTWLAESFHELSIYAKSFGVPLLYEPLNRYETNIHNQVTAAAAFLNRINASNILILGDLFHMNIEEPSIPLALEQVRSQLGYIHFADSNRNAVGMGHIAMSEIAGALKKIGYDGYISAEIYANPDPASAAQQSLNSFIKYFRP